MLGGGYDAGFLMEIAARDLGEARVCASDGFSGVALPDWVQAGAVLSPERARKLGAQLLLAADEYYLIQEQAREGIR